MADLQQFFGRIVDVARRTDGDELTAAASISDTVLHVGDTADFDETGGIVEVNGDRYVYLELDHDANTLTLDTGLLAAAAERDRVDVVDEELDQVVVEYVAHVELDEQDPGDEPIEVTVQHALVDYLTESVRGGFTESVTLLRTNPDEEPVIWEIDGKLVENIALETAVSDFDATMGQLQEDLTELNDVTLPALQADLDTLDGLFPITSTSISDSAITTPKIATNAVSADKIVANAISADKIAANAVSADKIAANAVSADKIAANAVTAAKISADAINGRTVTGFTISGGAVYTTGVGDSSGWVMTAVGLIGPSFTTTVNNVGYATFASEVHAGTGFHDDGLVGGGLTAASIGNGGRIVRTTSSQRYKHDIHDADLDVEAVLQLTPRAFKRTPQDEEPADSTEYVGFIAEEVAAIEGLEHFVFHDATGQPEGFHYDAFTAALVAVCQAQQAQIDDLTARVEALEAP